MIRANPEEVGMSSSRLSRINTIMDEYVASGQLAGTLTLVARHGKLVHSHCCGHADIESGQTMHDETLFRIYSMTKPITSVAMMMLYEENRFHLLDPVEKYLPALGNMKVLDRMGYDGPELVAADRSITVKDLLCHTSGLSYGFYQDTYVDHLYRECPILDSNYSLSEFVDKLGDLPLAYHPGTRWNYSVSTDVLGHLVECLAEQPLDDFFRERILRPLGMNDTHFSVPEQDRGRFASVYGPSKDGMESIDSCADSPFLEPSPFLSGGGGLVSTAPDYLKFAQFILNKGHLEGTRLLGRKTVETMTMNHLPAALMPMQLAGNVMNGSGFGLGFRVVLDPAATGIMSSAGSVGWGGVANTRFWVDYQENLLGIFMSQYMPADTYSAVSDFEVAVYQSLVD